MLRTKTGMYFTLRYSPSQNCSNTDLMNPWNTTNRFYLIWKGWLSLNISTRFSYRFLMMAYLPSLLNHMKRTSRTTCEIHASQKAKLLESLITYLNPYTRYIRPDIGINLSGLSISSKLITSGNLIAQFIQKNIQQLKN